MQKTKCGRWTVVDPTTRKWLCRCDCGTERRVDRYSLKDGRSISCGCHMAEVRASAEYATARVKHRIAVGDQFGRLTVVNVDDRRAVVTRCGCGAEHVVLAPALYNGTTKSCGCLKRDSTRERAADERNPWRTHGLARHPLYRTWRAMMGRCTDPRHQNWFDYGHRGIQVHEPWHDVAVFISDIETSIGLPEPGMTLDRVDNGGNYEPGNLQWATRQEQADNRRSTKLTPDQRQEIPELAAAGHSLGELARRFGVSQPYVSRLVQAARQGTERR